MMAEPSEASLPLARPRAAASQLWEGCVAVAQLGALPHHKLTRFCAPSIYRARWLVPAFAHHRHAWESPVKLVGFMTAVKVCKLFLRCM